MRGGDMNKIHFGGPTTPLRRFLAVLNILFFFSPQLKSLALLDKGQNRLNLRNWLRLTEDLIFWNGVDRGVKIQLCSNLGEVVLRG